jgi:hypothetical protein
MFTLKFAVPTKLFGYPAATAMASTVADDERVIEPL